MLLFCATHAEAQTRKGPAPQAPQDVLRTVAVYEWTGDLAKPTAARVVPVSLFIDHNFQDAALYLSRPMPLALEPGNIYELESAGVNQGTLTLSTASRLHSTNAVTSFDDGWFGYANWKPLQAPKPFVASTQPSDAHIVTSGEGKPHFTRTPDAPSPAPSSSASAPPTPAPAPSSAPSTTQSTSGDAPPPDPNRPILHHTAPGDAQNSGAPASSTQTADALPPAAASPAPATPTPAPTTPSTTQSKPSDTSTNDADRPTFPRPPPANTKKKSANTGASVTDAGGLLGDDPGRPHLHHGGATTGPSIPALHGLPPDMHQSVAVSDAATRPEHNFTYDWPDANQKAAMLAKLETLARAALPQPTAPAAPAHTRTHAHKPAPPLPITLLGEELHAYEISYGGVNVFVFSAHTGEGATLQNVTLIAQLDIYGAPHILLQSITGATHLDETPQMRFLDAVDADGDNRAELLFELRGQTQRQFALYRIAQGTATQEFLTGSTQ